MNAALAPLCAALLTTVTVAQVATGSIAATGFSSTTFGVIGPSLTITGYTAPFGGTTQCVLWDPVFPDDFLVGGFGFLGRVSITGPGTSVYTPITGSVGIVSQMSWDDAGNVVIADSGTNQLRLVDPATGNVTDITTGAQPWGTSLSAAARDPFTGDIVAGGNGELYRLANGAVTATTIATSLGGFVSGVQFDPFTGEPVATVLTTNRLVRRTSGGTVENVCPPGSLPGPNALAVDQNGDFVAGGGTGQIHRVPRAGGAPVFLLNNTSPMGNVNGLAVAGGGGVAVPFGQACDGASGPAALTATGALHVGGQITTVSENHAPNSVGVLVLGFDATQYLGVPLPFLLDPVLGTSGCSVYVGLEATFAGLTSTSAPATFTFGFALPAPFAHQRFFAQHVCFEPVAGGLSWSNGLAIRIP